MSKMKEAADALRAFADQVEATDPEQFDVRCEVHNEVEEGPPTSDGWKTYRPTGRRLVVLRIAKHADPADRLGTDLPAAEMCGPVFPKVLRT